MAHHDRQASLPGKSLQPVLKGMMPIAIGSACIAQQQDIGSIRVLMDTILPPPKQVIYYKACRFTAAANRDISFVSLHIINAIRHYFAFGKMFIVMIIYFYCLATVA